MAQGGGHLRVPVRGSQGRATPHSHCCPHGSQLCLLAHTPVLWAGDGPWQRCVPAPCLSCHLHLARTSSARAGPVPGRTHHLAPNGPHVLLLCQPVLILWVGRVLQ